MDFDLTIWTHLMQCREITCLLGTDQHGQEETVRRSLMKNTGKALRMCVSANVNNAIFNDCYLKRENGQGDFFHADSEYRPVKMQCGSAPCSTASMFREEKSH